MTADVDEILVVVKLKCDRCGKKYLHEVDDIRSLDSAFDEKPEDQALSELEWGFITAEGGPWREGDLCKECMEDFLRWWNEPKCGREEEPRPQFLDTPK